MVPPDEIFAASTFATHEEEIEYLKTLGFATNPYNKKVIGLQAAWDAAEQTSKDRDNFAYAIDGMVVKLNDNRIAEKVGVVGKTPRGWCAIKFAAEEVTTKITGITWQVGKAGKVTPVAELEPVILAGTTVKRASLHNYKMVQDLDIQAQDTVIIRKAGDIIPEVIQVLVNLRVGQRMPFATPTHCPVCNTELTFSTTNIDLICPNFDSCPAQVQGRLSYYTQRNIANITGLSDKILEKFIAQFGVRDIPDLYDLPWEKILHLEGFGARSVQNLQESIEKSKAIADYKFLAGLSIDGVGPEVAKLICEVMAQKQQQAKTDADESEQDELF